MKFGVLYDLRNPPTSEWFTPWPEFYAGALEHMQEMERLGFDTISLAEHHGDPEGYNPSMPVTLTAAAMPAEIEKGQNAGFEEYLTKPINVSHVLATISAYLDA